MSEDGRASLLRSIAEVARAVFSARAASILLLDDETDELVFTAVAGEGADTLVGRRIPSSTGIAGWVLVTRQPLLIDDVGADLRFGRDAAVSTGYVPRALMAAPLLREERALGVLEVLDPPEERDAELLDLLARHTSLTLDALRS